MPENIHHEIIAKIARIEFGTAPGLITRMTNGICNEVYSVTVGELDLIFRLNTEPRFMLGSHKNIPLFKAKGINVPDILAEDLSKTAIPLAYQVQSKIPGNDIGEVITTLTDDQLRAVGTEIANIFRQLSQFPNNGKFGVLWGDDKDLVVSWSAEVARVTQVVTGWGKKTGVLDAKLEKILTWINSEYKGYFESVRPHTYFGDIASKNVMIHEGRFSGLVDLDSLAQGDPLEAIGRIKASWYGTRQGSTYSEAVMDSLGLSEQQRKIVTMYALHNRTFWTLENGIQFNKNTSRTVDREREAKDKQVVDELLKELQGGAKTLEKAGEQQIVNIPEIQTKPPPVGVKPPRKPRKNPVQIESAATILNPTGKPALEPPPAVTELPRESRVNILHAATVPHKIMLETNGLSKTYTSGGVGFNALKDVDLRIYKGECVAIVGKSGSGKSTLMHLLACLDAPTEGYVYVDGDETTTMSETEKNRLRNEKFGFVFQQFFLNGRETVFENIVLPMRIRGASDFEMISNADEALASVELSDKSDKKAKDLSGGEKQRVCIARALVGKPQVIFADEPTGNLDSNTGAAVENMLFSLNREKSITLVIVTHDPDLSKRCGRIIEMKDGQIVAEYQAGEHRP